MDDTAPPATPPFPARASSANGTSAPAAPKQDAATLVDPPTRPGKNGGQLRSGGTNAGGLGGGGAAKIRGRAAASFKKRLKILEQIADGKLLDERIDRYGTIVKVVPSCDTRRAAIDTIGRYAGLQRMEHTGPMGAPIPVAVTGQVVMYMPANGREQRR